MFAAFKALSIGGKIAAIVGPILFLVGVFFAGQAIGLEKGKSQATTEISVFKSENAALRTELAEAKNEVDVRVVTQYRDRVQEVEVERVVYRDVIKEVPAQFPLSNGWIYVHNSAVAGVVPDDALASDATPSNVFDAEALPIIIDNYQTCKVDRARHNALIDWVEGVLESAGEINENQ